MRAAFSAVLLAFFFSGTIVASLSHGAPALSRAATPLSLERLSRDTFRYFWETTDPHTGLTPDRYPSDSPASIAAIGFALTAYAIGAEREYITRAQAAQRTRATLRFLSSLPMGPEASGVAGYQGFFYHFLNRTDGRRHLGWQVELSTVDTALLIAGALFAQTYFDDGNAVEAQIRDLADHLYRRVNWRWAQSNYPLISLGWVPGEGFLPWDWVGYNEAMILYILALGSPTYPVERDAWDQWADHYQDDWTVDNGTEYLTFAPMFGHQYSHVWIDFRDVRDDFMRDKGSDYFQNSRLATNAQRRYAITNERGWLGYGEDFWGLTASDGPGNFSVLIDGKKKQFASYRARGVGPRYHFDDGTLAPTAMLGSLPFAPEIVLPGLAALYEKYGEHLYAEYGFRDAYNPTFTFDLPTKTGKVVPGLGWFATDYIGIDQGPILAMAENFRSELVWRVMRKNPYIRRGLKRAGFRGGWLGD
jgi:hypothetical protein